MLTIRFIEINYSIKSLFNFLICKDVIIALRMLSIISENEVIIRWKPEIIREKCQTLKVWHFLFFIPLPDKFRLLLFQ